MTNYPELDVSRLRMLAALDGTDLHVSWGSYFTWDDSRRHATLERAARKDSVLVSYTRDRAPAPDLRFINRHADEAMRFALDPANGFHLLRRIAGPDGRFTVELWANFVADGVADHLTIRGDLSHPPCDGRA